MAQANASVNKAFRTFPRVVWRFRAFPCVFARVDALPKNICVLGVFLGVSRCFFCKCLFLSNFVFLTWNSMA